MKPIDYYKNSLDFKNYGDTNTIVYRQISHYLTKCKNNSNQLQQNQNMNKLNKILSLSYQNIYENQTNDIKNKKKKMNVSLDNNKYEQTSVQKLLLQQMKNSNKHQNSQNNFFSEIKNTQMQKNTLQRQYHKQYQIYQRPQSTLYKNHMETNKNQLSDFQNKQIDQIISISPLSSTDPQNQVNEQIAKQFAYISNTLLLQNYDPTRISKKDNGIVLSYGVNTHQGLIRNYNEDRISIILTISKPPHKENEISPNEWPTSSFFGVYDGHAGNKCSDFLRDNLHSYIIQNPKFPYLPIEAIQNGFEQCEKQILSYQSSQDLKRIHPINQDHSGSCAITLLIIGQKCYIANVGDSRAIMSSDQGKHVYQLSNDHKPINQNEANRIYNAGGKIYKTQINGQLKICDISNQNNFEYNQQQNLLGPYRVLPGRLAITRSFGDFEAKDKSMGGNQEVIIASPEITQFEHNSNQDFIILASDGIFDRLNCREVIECAWDAIKYNLQINPQLNEHQLSAIAVESIIKNSFHLKTQDNVTVIFIGLNGFIKYIQEYSNRESINFIQKPNNQLNNQFNKKPFKIQLQKILNIKELNNKEQKDEQFQKQAQLIYQNNSIQNIIKKQIQNQEISTYNQIPTNRKIQFEINNQLLNNQLISTAFVQNQKQNQIQQQNNIQFQQNQQQALNDIQSNSKQSSQEKIQKLFQTNLKNIATKNSNDQIVQNIPNSLANQQQQQKNYAKNYPFKRGYY